MKALIDPPSPFASLAEWKEFLADLRKAKPQTVEIKAAIREAEQMIQALRA